MTRTRRRIIRLMQEGLKARVRKRSKGTTMSDHDQPVADNLLHQEFTAARPNQRWVGDTGKLRIGSKQNRISQRTVAESLTRCEPITIVIVAIPAKQTESVISMRVLCRKPSVIRAGVLALALFPATLSLAEQPNTPPATTRYQVTVVRVKPDMLNEWIDLQKNEVIPAQKKGGVKERTVLQTAIGNAFEYTILTPFPSFEALDAPPVNVRALGAEAAARLGEKIRKCIDVQRSYLINRVDDLAIPQGDAIASRTTVVRPAPGKMQDYLSHLRADVLPAMKKAKADGKIAGYAVSTRGVGAQAGEATTTTYYNKFADMEGGNPVILALGAAAAAPITAKGAALATGVQTIIRRRVADLSF